MARTRPGVQAVASSPLRRLSGFSRASHSAADHLLHPACGHVPRLAPAPHHPRHAAGGASAHWGVSLLPRTVVGRPGRRRWTGPRTRCAASASAAPPRLPRARGRGFPALGSRAWHLGADGSPPAPREATGPSSLAKGSDPVRSFRTGSPRDRPAEAAEPAGRLAGRRLRTAGGALRLTRPVSGSRFSPG